MAQHPARQRKQRKAAEGNVTNSTNKRMRKRALGTTAIEAVQRWTMQLKPFELRFPHNIETFHEMYSRDDAVGGVLNATYALVENAFTTWTIDCNNKSEDSVRSATLIKHALHNLRDQTLRTVARNAATFNQFGFSVLEKDYRKLLPFEYDEPLPQGVAMEDVWVVDKLPMIPQRSLETGTPFIIGGEGRDILALRQNPSWFMNSSYALQNWQPPHDIVSVPRNKFMLMGMNVTDSTPMGVSPLEQVWTAWKEKKFFENYLSVGISKDMAGMPLLEIPQEILDRANADPTSLEGQLVTQMAEDVAAMHAGEQNMMIMPSDPFSEAGGSAKAFNLKFIGIEGAGKQFDLQESINKRKESIYQSFGALNLISNESKGGYNQLEGQNSIHLYFVKRVIHIIEEAINKDLIPQMLDLCGVTLSQRDMPKFKAGEIEPVSLEEVSKMIQRVKSVQGLVLSKENIIFYHKALGFPVEHMEDLDEKSLQDLMAIGDKGDSRAGDGMKTAGGGTGTTQINGDNNLDNPA